MSPCDRPQFKLLHVVRSLLSRLISISVCKTTFVDKQHLLNRIRFSEYSGKSSLLKTLYIYIRAKLDIFQHSILLCLGVCSLLFEPEYYFKLRLCMKVHRCGASGSIHACHAEGPGSIPGRDRFPGWGFFGVFPHLSDKRQERSPTIIWPS